MIFLKSQTIKSILIVLSFFPFLINGQTLYLSDTIEVSPDGTGSRSPRIALLEDNRPVVYWGKPGGNPTLYLTIWTDDSFGNPIVLNTNGIEPDLWSGGLGPQIAAQGNTIFLVFETYGEGIYCIKSSDGGQSFDAPVSVYVAPQGRVATLPSIAIDPDNNPVISFVTTNFSETEARYEITKSTDGGATFPPTTIANTAASGGEVCECCPASMAVVSNDEMYLGFRNNNNNLRDIWVAKSSDGGSNFTEALDIDTTDWIAFVCPQSGPDLMVSGDSIFSSFFGGANGSNIYFSSMSKNTMETGYQFQIPSFTGQNTTQNFPSIAGNGDTLGIVWQEVGANNFEIMMAWSANGSGDLLNNYLIIDDNISSQKQPDIAYHDGRFHIVYQDLNSGKVLYRLASFEEIVGVSQTFKDEFSVKISPNPVAENANVAFENPKSEMTKITLYNVNGQLLRKFESTGNLFEINCQGLENGVYFLNIQRGDQQALKQFIVKK